MVAASKLVSRHVPLTEAADIHDMPARYSGSKRARYERAVDSVLAFGLFPPDSYCKMFIKPDRVDGAAKVNPNPRAIQFRAAKYCVSLAQFLHPIEHHLYLFDGASAGVPRSRNIAKGLNSVARAELLVEKLSHFDDPRVISLDASRFDKHVNVAHLRVEHSIYLRSNNHKCFRDLLRKQLTNTVFTSLGVKYKVAGRRMSGDMNTACGNCVIMITMLIAYATRTELPRWDCLDDGDDCLLIIESTSLALVERTVKAVFLDYGMEMKVEKTADHISRVVFCQSSVVEYAESRFKFVRDYRAVISKSLTGVRHWQNSKYRKKVLQAIGLCELVLNLSVPVLQAFALAVLRNAGGKAPADLMYAPDGLRVRAQRDIRSLGLELDSIKPRPILDCARESFAIAFGLAPDEQVDLEERLNAWAFDVESLHHWGDEWDVFSWLSYKSSAERYPLQAKCQTK